MPFRVINFREKSFISFAMSNLAKYEAHFLICIGVNSKGSELFTEGHDV